MRVIRTEIYFDDVEPVELRPPTAYFSNLGLAVAWFKVGDPGPQFTKLLHEQHEVYIEEATSEAAARWR